MSFAPALCGGGDPSSLAGIRSRVGLGVCTINCGKIKSFGRLGDLGDLSSGVGGSISMNISGANETVGRVGIGRSNFGVFLSGIPVSFASLFITFMYLRF